MTERILLNTAQFRVSKPGVSVLTPGTTTPENLILSEETQNLGILMTGTATAQRYVDDGTTSYNGQTLMFPYDLGYIPYVMVHWHLLPNEAFTAPSNSESWRYPTTDDSTIDLAIHCYTLSDRLRYWRFGGSGTNDITFRYTVFYAKVGII